MRERARESERGWEDLYICTNNSVLHIICMLLHCINSTLVNIRLKILNSIIYSESLSREPIPSSESEL